MLKIHLLYGVHTRRWLTGASVAASFEKAARAAYNRAAIKELTTVKSRIRRVDRMVAWRFPLLGTGHERHRFCISFLPIVNWSGCLDNEVWRQFYLLFAVRRNYALSFGKRRNWVTSYVEAYDLVDFPKTHNLWFLICLEASYLSFVKQRVPRQINMWDFRCYPTVHNRQVMKCGAVKGG